MHYLHSRLCLPTALIECLTVLLENLNFLPEHSKHLGGPGPCQMCL